VAALRGLSGYAAGLYLEPARDLMPANVNWVATVYHGLPAAVCPFDAKGGDYLAFLGRMSPEKRPDRAIEIAIRAGLRLRLAAKADEVDRSTSTR
jgi:glycosyltransferase involved in cell wall biosynthesis